jgi:hypothetical protein
MKRIIGTFILVTPVGLATHIILAYVRGTPTDYHWFDTLVFSATSAAATGLLCKYRRRSRLTHTNLT